MIKCKYFINVHTMHCAKMTDDRRVWNMRLIKMESEIYCGNSSS